MDQKALFFIRQGVNDRVFEKISKATTAIKASTVYLKTILRSQEVQKYKISNFKTLFLPSILYTKWRFNFVEVGVAELGEIPTNGQRKAYRENKKKD